MQVGNNGPKSRIGFVQFASPADAQHVQQQGGLDILGVTVCVDWAVEVCKLISTTHIATRTVPFTR